MENNVLVILVAAAIIVAAVFISGRKIGNRIEVFKETCVEVGGTPIHNGHQWTCLLKDLPKR